MAVSSITQGNLEDAFSLYEQAIAIEKGKEHSQVLPALYAQYARFIYFGRSMCGVPICEACFLIPGF